ncbi:unnamed protein product [Allacma fusca]|uniref:Clathrin/coatomer adaptor adaptin-like N-terminal domain-containing protein n=1 Tax=Allacma fusca TaxID=39272 RepID=A0A8J2KYX5_9HEXA|nr:unnamed protein product [Allacma fusca]
MDQENSLNFVITCIVSLHDTSLLIRTSAISQLGKQNDLFPCILKTALQVHQLQIPIAIHMAEFAIQRVTVVAT